MIKASYLDDAVVMEKAPPDVNAELKRLDFTDPLFLVAFRESRTSGKQLDAVLLVKNGKTLQRTDLRNRDVTEKGELLRPRRNGDKDEVLQLIHPDGSLFICIPIPNLWIWI